MRILAFVAALSLSGCAIFQGYVRPTATLQDVKVSELTREKARVILVLKVKNQNPYGIQLAPFTYRLWVDGNPTFLEIDRQTYSFAGNSETVIEVPLMVQYDRVLASITQMLLNQPVQYEMKGKAKAGILSYEFDWSGDYSH